QQPLWEGFDEWAHFEYIQTIAENAELPKRTDAVSSEVRASLQIVPLSKSAAVTDGAITHDAFWQLQPEERWERTQRLHKLPASGADLSTIALTQYEAQQPPLYYLVMTVPYLLGKTLSLPAQVLILRLLSIGIASAVVFLAYAVARQVLPGVTFAVLVAMLMACLPGFFIDVCRVGNECLSIVLTGAVVLLMFRVVRSDAGLGSWMLLGAALAAALLTKAYALAFLPVLPIAACLSLMRNRPLMSNRWSAGKTAAGFILALLVIVALSGWWYWRSWVNTGTLSGEQLHAAAAQFTLAGKLSALRQVDWHSVLDTAAFSHIWVGGWSFLVVRSWMYRVFEIIAIVSALGLCLYLTHYVRYLWRSRLLGASGARIAILLSLFLIMCAAVGYHSFVIFLTQNISTAAGWYLYAVIVAEGVLLAVGLTALFGIRSAQRTYAAVCMAAVALDLYTVHFVLMPYYTGGIRHTPSGTLESFHLQTLAAPGAAEQIFQRLAVNEALGTPVLLAGLWG
ncbi:MAG: hypothetical protein ACRD7E_02720, partial [Bryobacteraceae bacterium]